jgi:CubicO group peptidase (beta-lactamase class C family)
MTVKLNIQQRPRLKVIAVITGIALIALAAIGARRVLPVLSFGAGLKAGHMCSAVFVAGRSPDAVLMDEFGNLDPRLRLVPDPIVDRESRSVAVPLLFGSMTRRAAYREGVGCTVLPPGSSLQDGATLPRVKIPKPPGDPSIIPWPDGDLLPGDPLPPEVDAQGLSTVVEAAFTGERERPYKTIGLVVVYRGRIIAERYAPGFDAHTQYRSWSSAKSITGALVGILVGQGRIEVGAPAPIPEWRGPDDPRGQITVAHLLHMSSGLESDGARTFEAYWGGIDTGAAVARARLEATPGKRWKYSNYDTLLLVRAMREVIGDDTEYLTLPHRALLHKIGMRDTVPELDPYGNFILSSQVYTTARDLARFGLLYQNDGIWNGERILPEGWVEFTVEPAPATLLLPEDHEVYAGYGVQFWLYGRHPRLPADAYSTSGARGQHATIVPSRDLVVARTGLDPLVESGWDQPAFVADVLSAISPGAVAVPSGRLSDQ